MSFGFALREAIASCALEHSSGCVCVICRANQGDIDAFAELAIAVQDSLTDADLRALHRGKP